MKNVFIWVFNKKCGEGAHEGWCYARDKQYKSSFHFAL